MGVEVVEEISSQLTERKQLRSSWSCYEGRSELGFVFLVFMTHKDFDCIIELSA